MEQNQREPTPLNPNQKGKLCFKCGFPNRSTDLRCVYCEVSLEEPSGIFSMFQQTYYVLRWRLELKQKREGIKKNRALFYPVKFLGYFILGIVLSGTGLYLMIEAVNSNSFSRAIISVLLLLYGLFTLKGLIFRQK
tara:strand:- start:223 stop:630 length:408 start_codon:yes stop_codon:yes gene_type:complete